MAKDRLDIAIVGGGIAGLYCAWKLGVNHNVTLFECLDRFGGRIETVDLDEFKAECGPMRFERTLQKRFEALTEFLEIDFTGFPSPRAGLASERHYQLPKCEKRGDQEPSSLDLLKYGIFQILHEDERSNLTLPDVIHEHAASALADPCRTNKDKITTFADSFKKEEDYNDIRTKRTLNGTLLYTMGLWNALSCVLSPDAVAKIRDIGTFYHLLPENPSASEWIIFWLRLFKCDGGLSTIPAGVATIVYQLVARIDDMRSVQLNKKTEIRRVGYALDANKVRLTIGRSDAPELEDDFDHVILAVPKVPLLALTEMFPWDVRRYIEGVIAFPLLKLFAVIDGPWWRRGERPPAQHGAHLVPTREVHYFERDNSAPEGDPRECYRFSGNADPGHRGMVMFYTDRPATAYWRPYIEGPHSQVQKERPVELKRDLAARLHDMLRFSCQQDEDSLLNAVQIESKILSFAIRDWSQPPFGAASHAWAPGIHVPDALERLKAFSLIGRPGRNNLHICGEAYSGYQGFIEGALASAEEVINHIAEAC